VLWRDAADRDVVEIYIQLALDGIEVAERFVDDVEQAVQFVRSTPRAGRLGSWTPLALKGLRVW
jgi:plasmid stabilization system protein ParE